MSRLQVWSYLSEYEELRGEILGAVDEVFKSGRLILGERTEALEAEFASYIGSPSGGVGVNSGTDALFIGLKALGVGPGDEVVTVANTAVPTVSAIVSTGATARFVDIDADTYLMDCDRLEAAITPRTRCILPVHLYGQCVDMDKLQSCAESHDLRILEDCAQSAGATFDGRQSGQFGEIGAFSFYPTKLLGGYGDGGMILSRTSDLEEKCRSLRMYGMKGAYYAEEHGYNSRLDEVQAAIILLKLKHLDEWIARRRALAERYRDRLGDSDLVLPAEAPGNRHAYYVYVVRHPDRERLMQALAARDIHVNISYPFPISTMRGYADLGYGEGDLPITEKLAREIFSLPMYPGLSEGDQDRVCDALLEALG